MNKSNFIRKKNIVLSFLIIISIIFILGSLKTTINIANYSKSISKFDNSYIIKDTTTEDHINYMMNYDRENSLKNFNTLVNYMFSKNNVKFLTHFYYLTNYFDNEGNQIRHYFIDNNFNAYQKLDIFKGKSFSEDYFTEQNKIIPIVIGFNLKDKYTIGEIYSLQDPLTGITNQYKVIGILSKNFSYISPNFDMYENLNYSIIQPISLNSIINTNQFSAFDLLITRSIAITNDISNLKEIESKSKELGLFSIKYISSEESLNKIIELIKPKQYISLFLSCISTIIIILLNFVNNKRKKDN